MLDRLPEGSRTLDGAARYLTGQSKLPTIRETLQGWREVFGVEVAFEASGEPSRAFVFSETRDFSGDWVYAVHLLPDGGYAWSVFLWRGRGG